MRKYIPNELRGKYADGTKPAFDRGDHAGTAAPIAQVCLLASLFLNRFNLDFKSNFKMYTYKELTGSYNQLCGKFGVLVLTAKPRI